MSLSVDITKKFKDFSLNVTLETSGNRLGLLGASGCGKSMTLKCIAGIEKPDKGKIVLNNKVLFDSDKKINLIPQKRKVGYLFQNYALFPNMTVAQNIGIGMKEKWKRKQPKVMEMLELFHLSGLENRYPAQLSGGQQQRVALARIFAYEPDVLMLDEPFSALDAFLKESLLEELLETLKIYKGDIIIVSHNRDEIYSLCERLAVIDSGELIMTGDTEKIFSHPKKLAAARLTGCKNISPIRKINEYTVEAIDWGIILHTSRKVTSDMGYIGIRAHDLQPAVENCENSFAVGDYRIVDSPFERNLLCKSGHGEIWWKVNVDKINHQLQMQVPKFLALPKEALLMLQ
ncbi:ATP-binding cassette domain-containing protein [Anaerocolumna sp. AGMB13020]|uniref:sulfate/molybdate ABC transporter ATP-binding protein n=1 Tax=Anaerocolumna sp. AGMB13020 TaxID=3081750 RepID=UPI002953EEC5|nr:ATP-binding cassette domain-containing protein [Anaerocolumna sp. AGMB13020]WOO36819.1 ATP-binding cassette domain-containing protein [Anaerocolumna sp. AGMB13020]